MSEPPQPTRKSILRKQILTARSDLPDRDARSQSIHDRWIQSKLHLEANAFACYVNVRTEVSTRALIESCWKANKRVAVPYCMGHDLELTWITSWDDLTTGRFGILEPTGELRDDFLRRPRNDKLDVVFVPGVAFDRQGGRLGHGQGFYDRLLSKLPKSTILVGVAFDCQIIPEVPTEPHDVPMNFILTESSLHNCH